MVKDKDEEKMEVLEQDDESKKTVKPKQTLQ